MKKSEEAVSKNKMFSAEWTWHFITKHTNQDRNSKLLQFEKVSKLYIFLWNEHSKEVSVIKCIWRSYCWITWSCFIVVNLKSWLYLRKKIKLSEEKKIKGFFFKSFSSSVDLSFWVMSPWEERVLGWQITNFLLE